MCDWPSLWWGQGGMILAEFFFVAFIWFLLRSIQTRKNKTTTKTRLTSGHLGWTSLANKGFIINYGKITLWGNNMKNPIIRKRMCLVLPAHGGRYVLNTVSAYGYVYAGPRKGHLLHLLGSSRNNKGNDNIGKELSVQWPICITLFKTYYFCLPANSRYNVTVGNVVVLCAP